MREIPHTPHTPSEPPSISFIGQLWGHFIAWVQSLFARRAKDSSEMYPNVPINTPIEQRTMEQVVTATTSEISKQTPQATVVTPLSKEENQPPLSSKKIKKPPKETKKSSRKKSSSKTPFKTPEKKPEAKQTTSKKRSEITNKPTKLSQEEQIKANFAERLKKESWLQSYVDSINIIAKFDQDIALTFLNDLLKTPKSARKNDPIFTSLKEKIDQKVDELIGNKIDTELNSIQKARAQDLYMTANDCLATDYAKILSKLIIDDRGNLDQTTLASIIRHRKKQKTLTTTSSFVHNTHVTQMLKKLQKDLEPLLLNIKAPKNQDSDSAMFVRMAVGKAINDEVTDVDAKRAVVASLLDEFYQDEITESCATTSLAMNIRSGYPELFIHDMASILEHGFYTRNNQGKHYLFFPMKNALDRKLYGTTETAVTRLTSINKVTPLNKDTLFSLITAFKNTGLEISETEIIETAKKLTRKKLIYIDKNNKTTEIPLDNTDQINQILQEVKKGNGYLIKKETVPLKTIVDSIILKKVGQTPEHLKLKNFVLQNFSNNQVNRLLRSWEYSIATATPSNLQITDSQDNLAFKESFTAKRIRTLFNLDEKFEILKKRMTKAEYEKFIENFYRLLNGKIGLEYNEGAFTLFDKTSSLGYKDNKISSLQDLQTLVGSVLGEANELSGNTIDITSLVDRITGQREKDAMMTILKRENRSDEDETRQLKKFLQHTSLGESLATYCGTVNSTVRTTQITPTSAKDLLQKLITEIRKQAPEERLEKIPVMSAGHSFTLIPNEGLFKNGIDSKLTAEQWLATLKTGETVVIADSNYTENNQHIYFGIQKISNREYKLVEILDNENLHSGNPEISPEPIMTIDFLNKPWNIATNFNHNTKTLKNTLISPAP